MPRHNETNTWAETDGTDCEKTSELTIHTLNEHEPALGTPNALLSATFTERTDKLLTMQFTGCVAGQQTCLLLDSGATQSFMNSEFCKQLGATITHKAGTVTGADGVHLPIVGCCVVPLRIQSYSGDVPFLVTDLAPQGEAILGETWLNSTKAQMDFGSRCVKFSEPNVTLRAEYDASVGGHNSPILSCLQGKKAMRTKGCVSFLIAVTCADVTYDPTPAASSVRVAQASSCVTYTQSCQLMVEQTPTQDTDAPFQQLQNDIERLLIDNKDIFPEQPPGLAPERPVAHTNPLENTNFQPPHRPLYRLSQLEVQEATKQVQ